MAWNELWRLRLHPNETSVRIEAEGHKSQEHLSFIVQKDDVVDLLTTWGLIPVAETADDALINDVR